MNPIDLLTPQQHIVRSMHQAKPDAPQVHVREPRHLVRRAAARATASLGVRLIAASKRLQSPSTSSCAPATRRGVA